MGISVALLAYKEEDNLKILLPQIIEQMKKTSEDYEILVIDSKEPLDNTKMVCDLFGAKYINQEEPFFGGAFKTAIKYATMDKFLILDSDCSHNPNSIPDIYKSFCNGADLVIGSRYTEGGVSNDSKTSYIMSQILNTLFRITLGVKAKDISTDYRMYHTNQLKQVELYCENYDILQEVILKLKINKPNFIIEEIPIVFNKREFGESKRSLVKFIMSYARTILKLTSLRIVSNNQRDSKLSEQKAELITNILLYGIIGVFAAVVDFTSFCLINVMTNHNVPEISNIIGALLGFFVSFYLNTFYNFKKSNNLMKRFISYGLICIIGVIVSTGIIYFCKDLLNIYLLKLICIAVAAIIQFILNKFITYAN